MKIVNGCSVLLSLYYKIICKIRCGLTDPFKIAANFILHSIYYSIHKVVLLLFLTLLSVYYYQTRAYCMCLCDVLNVENSDDTKQVTLSQQFLP